MKSISSNKNIGVKENVAFVF